MVGVNVYTPSYIIAWVRAARLMRNPNAADQPVQFATTESLPSNEELQSEQVEELQQPEPGASDLQVASVSQSLPVYSDGSPSSKVIGLVGCRQPGYCSWKTGGFLPGTVAGWFAGLDLRKVC